MAITDMTDPLSSVGRVTSGKTIQERGLAGLKEIESLMRGRAAEEEAAALEEARLKREMAAKQTGIEETFAREKRRVTEEFQTKLPQRPTFNPTEFDSVEAGKLAGLTAIVGTLVGGISGRAALKSMAGFTKGAKEGRADLYDREVKQYKADLDGWKDEINLAKDKLAQVIDLLGTDRTAALVKAKELEPMLQEGLIKQKLRQKRYTEALDVANNAAKSIDQVELSLSKTLGKDPSKIKLSDKLIDRWTTRTNLIDDLKKALPIMERLKKEGTWSKLSWTMLADPRAAEYSMRNDPEAVQLVRILAKLRGKEFETAGKALTQREDQILRPVFGVTGRLDDAAIATVAEAIKEMEQSNKGLLAGVEGMPEFVTRYELLLRTQGNPNAYRELQESANDLRNVPAPSAEPTVNRANLPTPRTQAEFNALDPGALYVDPDDNKVYRKPKARQ